MLPLTTKHSRASDGFSLVKFDRRRYPDAVCLDGTAGGFYHRPGSVADAVVVHMEGGGWCYTEADCLARANTAIGSSSGWAVAGVPDMDGAANGLLSSDPTENPDFANWTKYHLNYCDGASFAGSGSAVINGKTLQFRGAAMLDAFIDTLLAITPLSELIVGGTSAGGLATYLHIDHYRDRMPSTVRVAGMPDAGFFLDTPTYTGANLYTSEMKYVTTMQNVTGNLNRRCTAANPGSDAWRCFMAEYTAPHITTPTFALQSAYDAWQLPNVLAVTCGFDVKDCSPAQKAAFLGFRDKMLAKMAAALAVPTFGLWMDSCVLHGQQDVHGDWDAIKINGVTARKAFGDWYFGRNATTNHHIDCAYPCCNDRARSQPR